MTDRTAIHSTPAQDATWVTLVAGAAILGSLFFACATPFAALAAVAGSRMSLVPALVTMMLAFAANQAIGFGFHHYPVSANSIGWGLAIGTAAVCAMVAARMVAASWVGIGADRWNSATAIAFVAAFCCDQAVLYAATWPLASGTAAFAAPIVLRIAAINAVALAGLLVVQSLAQLAGLPLPAVPRRTRWHGAH